MIVKYGQEFIYTKWRNVIRPCLFVYNVYNVLINFFFIKNLSKQARRNPSLATKILPKKNTAKKEESQKMGKYELN
jgi:hypothetical protein